MKKKNTFILAAAIPLLILLAMTVKPLGAVLFGQEILLQTRVVDPNDLFRGDYISLGYQISEVPKEKLPDFIKNYKEQAPKKSTLYVKLKQEGKFFVADTVSQKSPQNGIYLKGTLNYYNYDNMPDIVNIDYTLDKFFVKQGSGYQLQEKSRMGELIGIAKVLNGYAILTDVQDGSVNY